MSRAGRHRCDGARWRCDVAAMARAAMSRAAMSRCDVAMMRRVYYTPERRFEQSYDVYYPANPDGSLPLVLLVVGSAWLGHSALIYAVTSWWNASGPRAVASTGAVCICIRHRGAFPRVASRGMLRRRRLHVFTHEVLNAQP